MLKPNEKMLSKMSEELSEQYDNLKNGKIDVKLSAELSNAAGKNLKGEQLRLGWAGIEEKIEARRNQVNRAIVRSKSKNRPARARASA